MGKKGREKRLRREQKANGIDVSDKKVERENKRVETEKKRGEQIENIAKFLKENIGKFVYIRLNANYDDPVYIHGVIVSVGASSVVLTDPYQNWGRLENDDEIELTEEDREYCSLSQDLDNFMGMNIEHDDFADFGLSMNKDETMNVSLNFVYEIIPAPWDGIRRKLIDNINEKADSSPRFKSTTYLSGKF